MSNCIHHWIINSTNLGKCIKCSAIQQFPQSKYTKISYGRFGTARPKHWGLWSGEDDNPSQQNALKILEDL